MVPEIVCPSCQSDDVASDENGSYKCQTCSTTFTPGNQICSVCEHINPPEAEECSNCSEPLTSFSQVIARHKAAEPPLRQRQMRVQATSIQSTELEASRRRMDDFEQVDRNRKELDAKLAFEQSERERRLLTYAFIATIVMLLVVVVIGILIIT